LLVLLACVAMAACTTTEVRKAAPAAISAPVADSKVIVVNPDVKLAVLTAAGLQEPREDWSQSARANLNTAINDALKGRAHRFEALDPQASMEGRAGQLLRLHEAVGQSILVYSYGGLRLPTKAKGFDWTLGDGAQVLGQEHQAAYALFVTGRGTYASAGRAAVMIGAAMLGVGVPMGSQQVFASLVDLRTGQVVWFNVATAGPNADIRSAEGAAALTRDLLKGAPL
jgi:hypothetical protein